MGSKTGISWADATWNFVRGCSTMVEEVEREGKKVKVISEACRNCYAEAMAANPRLSGPGKPYAGLVVLRNNTPKWTGEVRFIEKHLLDPLRWRDPRRIFTNSMSDLFHPNVPFELLDEALYIAQRAHWHIYQTLTKRVMRMLEFSRSSTARAEFIRRNAHIHWGISVENQEMADLRIPFFVDFPAAVRWLSIEPQLGPVNLRRWLPHDFSMDIAKGGHCEDCGEPRSGAMHQSDAVPMLHWIVAGGESGKKARPTNPAWFRDLRSQCERAGIPFFFKQWGEWAPVDQVHHSIVGMKVPGHNFGDGNSSLRFGVYSTGNTLDGVKIEQYPPVLPGQLVAGKERKQEPRLFEEV